MPKPKDGPTKNPALAATNAIIKALLPFEQPLQARVLLAVCCLMDIEVPPRLVEAAGLKEAS